MGVEVFLFDRYFDPRRHAAGSCNRNLNPDIETGYFPLLANFSPKLTHQGTI